MGHLSQRSSGALVPGRRIRLGPDSPTLPPDRRGGRMRSRRRAMQRRVCGSCWTHDAPQSFHSRAAPRRSRGWSCPEPRVAVPPPPVLSDPLPGGGPMSFCRLAGRWRTRHARAGRRRTPGRDRVSGLWPIFAGISATPDQAQPGAHQGCEPRAGAHGRPRAQPVGGARPLRLRQCRRSARQPDHRRVSAELSSRGTVRIVTLPAIPVDEFIQGLQPLER